MMEVDEFIERLDLTTQSARLRFRRAAEVMIDAGIPGDDVFNILEDIYLAMRGEYGD